MKEIKAFKVGDEIPNNAHFIHWGTRESVFYEVPIVEEKGKTNKDKEKEVKQAIREVIAHLNLKAGTSYTERSKESIKLIRALLNNNFTVAEMKTVIDKKCEEWLDNPKMSVYLRPSTIFKASKFEDYLNQKSSGEVANQGFDELDEFLKNN